jgi:hypothetical protein
MRKCECGGEIEQGKGCLTYLGSDDHIRDAQHEDYMRDGGLGFATQYDDSFDAMMLMHLQGNGFDYNEASDLLTLRNPEQALGEQ